MSSLLFTGNANSYLNIPNSTEFNFGTGDFTIEWYQYQTDINLFSRVFQIGDYPSTYIGVSIEGNAFFYWRNDQYISVQISNHKNKWVHFAISRSNNTTNIFMDGSSIITDTLVVDFNETEYNLVIANQSNKLSDVTAFGGYISYFSWVKGIALYTSNFTVPTNYPSITSNYVLLLTASSFNGTLGNTVENYNVSRVQETPPGFGVIAPISVPQMFKSMFSDNSRVFYKPGSLASCGVGSVRNSSIKSRKI